jgi:ribonuclease D
MRETSRHREAFEYFVELGGVLSEENITKISQKHHVHMDTIKRWSSQFGWVSRADRILEKVHEKILEKQINEIVKVKEKQLGEVRQIKAFLMSTIQNAIDRESKSSRIVPSNSVDIASLSRSINELIKTESLLIGEPTERTDRPNLVLISPAGKRIEIDDEPE